MYYVYMLISKSVKPVTYVGYTNNLKKRKLLAGIHNGTVDYAQKMISKGFNLVTVGADQRFMSAGAKTAIEKIKGKSKGSDSKGY